MIEINQLDLFSGIGGFHLGFERAGYKVNSYFSEIDKHAVAVYKQQFKESKYVGSVTNVRGADLPQIDLITFGSPCQDFSLAGKRQGMGGERSSLILEAIRLISECRPRVFVWENVKGTFSSNDGEDFAAILQSFTNIGGYRLEWQLLNTSWFLPQNRERIYLVGYSTTLGGDWRGVFPIKEVTTTDFKLSRHHAKANCIAARYGNDANGSYVGERKQFAQEVKVKSATKQGYEIATEGDTINLTPPDSETRRGRVGKQNAQTLETSCNQGVIQANYNYKALNKSIENNRHLLKEGVPKAIDCYNQRVRDESPCLTSPEHNTTRLFDGYRIRRLTPIECERLQGFPDNHTSLGDYDGEVKPVSNTQRYKQCGNAVTVDVVKAVAERLKPIFNA
jgi:DNA (cytosine-5)-methyltransferase 1